ncbi:hypothetical protein [Candidatus Magnetaquicoccus inordinatus]|uniref:hypothetical protein n=1 Tax=Candidatus Magnetaquicoccus inordinatus TaxID=2496818 RepID=UPI00102B4A9C|nr:hypothetical protein [Candidatus Magnetaquicoccus inordinatus]
MAHVARIDENGIVVAVHCIDNSNIGNLEFPDSEPLAIAFLESVHGPGKIWKQCSYNNKFRGHYPAPGETYDPVLDVFIQNKPDAYPSWVCNKTTGVYEPPFPAPSDGNKYRWVEAEKNWAKISQQET